MSEKRIMTFMLAMTLCACTVLIGCGADATVNDVTSGTVAEEKSSEEKSSAMDASDSEITSSKTKSTLDDIDGDNMISLADITDEAEFSEAESDSLIDSFSEDIVGCYVYESDDPLENRVFEFRNTDGRLYFEYESECDYAGAELELLGKTVTGDSSITEYQVMMYPFSGFSFAGEFWGKGFSCSIKKCDNKTVEIVGADSLLGDSDVSIKKTFNELIHDAEATEYHNTFADEILGSWRCTTTIDGDEYDVYLEFTESGQFTLVSKAQDYPVAYYIGSYDADWYDEGLLGNILCERFAYGDMPYEWKLIYDTDSECPVVVEDYNEDEPGKYNEDEFLPFKKSSPGEGPKIKPGPGSRGDELQKLFDSYLNGGEDEYE